jgi:hypothetical protein
MAWFKETNTILAGVETVIGFVYLNLWHAMARMDRHHEANQPLMPKAYCK